MSKQYVYGGSEYEVYGQVADLRNTATGVTFRLDPFLAKDVAITDGISVKPAMIFVCHRLTRTAGGMVSDADVFVANRSWHFSYGSKIRLNEGDFVRIFVKAVDIKNASERRMEDGVILPLSDVLK